MKRIRKKYRLNIKLKDKLLIILVLLVVSIIYVFKIFNERAKPLFMEYSTVEVEKLVTLVVNSTVNDIISKDKNMDNIFTSENNINNKALNSITYNSLKYVKLNLKYLEEGKIDKLTINKNIFDDYNIKKLKKGIVYELPSGVIFNNPITMNVLPKIPVKLNIIGSLAADIDTSIEEYGINSALFKVDLNIHMTVKILLPFTSKDTKIDTKIPIVIKIIEGKVPSLYLDKNLVN